jgi:hypothetical protein
MAEELYEEYVVMAMSPQQHSPTTQRSVREAAWWLSSLITRLDCATPSPTTTTVEHRGWIVNPSVM